MRKIFKRSAFCLIGLIYMGAAESKASDSKLSGNIQIQTSKTLEGRGNVDQLFGRANMMWAFQEVDQDEIKFSSLIHMRVYPAGFGYEPLIGASFQNNADSTGVPAIPNRTPPDNYLPTTQIYQAWIQYQFPDFDIRVGRMITSDTRSLHFGNYLDFNPGGKLAFSRDGIHNALEFFKVYKNFHTKVHLGVGDAVGNRGFLRLHEKITLAKRLKLGLGYRVNVFDMINYDFNDPLLNLRNTVDVTLSYPAGPFVDGFLEASWSRLKGGDPEDRLPVLAGFDVNVDKILKVTGVPQVLDMVRLEGEYLLDRYKHPGSYNGVDQDLLWNLYFEKTWMKRMFFQVGLFAAPTASNENNVGAGVRFTSQIN